MTKAAHRLVDGLRGRDGLGELGVAALPGLALLLGSPLCPVRRLWRLRLGRLVGLDHQDPRGH